MTVQQALQYVASGGSVALTIAFVSWLAENVPAWKTVAGWLKQLIMIGLSGGLGIGAVYVTTSVPAETLEKLAPYFAALMLSFVGVLASQVWHQLVNKANPTVSAGEPIAVTQVPAADASPKP